MVREGFPPISRPLPVLLQGQEYEDHPLVTKAKETSTFEKTSSYNWFYSFWTNILSAKWASNLISIKVPHESSVTISTSKSPGHGSETIDVPKPKAIFSNPRRPGSGGGPDWQAQKDSWRRSRSRTLPDLPRLSWTDWRAEDLLRVVRGSLEEENAPLGVDSSSDKGTPSMGNDLFKDFIEDALLQADDLDEIDFWTTHFAVDGDLLWKAIDCNLFKVSPPAWETLAYLSGEKCTIESIRKLYCEGQHNIKMLGAYLLACDTEDYRMSLALWRIWAYCILSIESMIVGECIAVQVAWLRGSTIDRAMLGKPRLDDGKNENWKLCRTNGIFAQSNRDLQKSDADDMIQIWDLLRHKWSEVMAGKGCEVSEEWCIMHVFSRITGPRDILNILQGSRHNSLGFQRAFRITHRESRVDRGSKDTYTTGRPPENIDASNFTDP